MSKQVIKFKAIYGTGIIFKLHKADWLFCFCSTPEGGNFPLVNDGKAYL